jgi:hypothetical protein
MRGAVGGLMGRGLVLIDAFRGFLHVSTY